MFKTALATFVNPSHELFLLGKQIDWNSLDYELDPVCDKPGKPHAIEYINGTDIDQAFTWDLNGNLSTHTDNIKSLNRYLCWDEENRLMAVKDQNYLSAYIYDAAGERVWKLSGEVTQMKISGKGTIDVASLSNKTLYISPYVVYNEQGYSKHYYAGAERVSSRIGGGTMYGLMHPINDTVSPITDDYPELSTHLWDMLERSFSECLDLITEYITYEPYMVSIQESANQNNSEPNWYIYHSDHLGSSSFLTDASGTPTQHLQYLPFGENYIEQRATTDYYTPYTFSAKERDFETSYSYFGARYYDPNVSVWLSVDPMADKYPSMSAFMYCAGNPVMLVDPDGNYFFGLFGSTRAQREAAREYAKATNGEIHNIHSKNVTVTYLQAIPGYVSSVSSKLPMTILNIVTFNKKGEANNTGKLLNGDLATSQMPQFPVDIKTNSFLKGSGLFGSSRDNGKRKHAGSDIYAPIGTVVSSMDDGIVLRGAYDFFRGSSAIEIDHGDYIARYCEIDVCRGLKQGSVVNRGQKIGNVSDLGLNNSMLHLELYSGKETGSLTNRDNRPYQRRNDLLNPTNLLKTISHEN